MSVWLDECADGARLRITVRPRASRTETAGTFDGRLRIKVAAPPVEGAANKAITKFLAKSLGVTKREVEIVSGQTGRNKTVIIRGRSTTEVARLLSRF